VVKKREKERARKGIQIVKSREKERARKGDLGSEEERERASGKGRST
jgi:hypothetical protein